MRILISDFGYIEQSFEYVNFVSDIIAPVALPNESEIFEDFVGEPAIAVGFGMTADGSTNNYNKLMHLLLIPLQTPQLDWFIYDRLITYSSVNQLLRRKTS